MPRLGCGLHHSLIVKTWRTLLKSGFLPSLPENGICFLSKVKVGHPTECSSIFTYFEVLRYHGAKIQYTIIRLFKKGVLAFVSYIL
jgi:hypothetical protein